MQESEATRRAADALEREKAELERAAAMRAPATLPSAMALRSTQRHRTPQRATPEPPEENLAPTRVTSRGTATPGTSGYGGAAPSHVPQ